jgi:hypothetical protein
LESTRVIEAPGVTHLRFRVLKEDRDGAEGPHRAKWRETARRIGISTQISL